MKRRIAIVFDGRRWHVRRIAVIEHDGQRDMTLYHCDKPISSDHKALEDVPQVAELLKRQKWVYDGD